MNQGQQILLHPQTPLEHLQRQYLQSMIRHNCAERKIEYWAMNLLRFNTWCDAHGIKDVIEFTHQVLAAYRQYLFHRRNPRTDQPPKFSTQLCYLIVVRRWCTWLHKHDLIKDDLGKNFELPKRQKRLPVEVPTAREVESMWWSVRGRETRTAWFR